MAVTEVQAALWTIWVTTEIKVRVAAIWWSMSPGVAFWYHSGHYQVGEAEHPEQRATATREGVARSKPLAPSGQGPSVILTWFPHWQLSLRVSELWGRPRCLSCVTAKGRPRLRTLLVPLQLTYSDLQRAGSPSTSHARVFVCTGNIQHSGPGV